MLLMSPMREPIAEPNYWRLDLPGLHVAPENCPPGRKHRTTCWDFTPCNPPEACLGDNMCMRGYTGERCASCCDVSQTDNPECYSAKGVQMLYSRKNGQCQPCPDYAILLIAPRRCI